MLKTLAIASLAAFATFAVVVGCGSTDTGGYVKSRSAGDDDDTTSKKTSSSSSGSAEVAADCTSLPKADDRPACDQCTRSKCCKEYATCEKSPACKATADCIAKAASAFDALTCGLGDDELNALGQCVQAACKTECPPTLGLDGGLGDDDPLGTPDGG